VIAKNNSGSKGGNRWWLWTWPWSRFSKSF